jgi:hypothetical protein
MKLAAKHSRDPFHNAQPTADLPRFISITIHRFFHSTPVLSPSQTNGTEEKARKNLLLYQLRFSETYCFGAAGFGVVGRGRAVVGATDGPDGIGAATPELALYAVTTA